MQDIEERADAGTARAQLEYKPSAHEQENKRLREQLDVKDAELNVLRAEARPGMEVIYVDEGVARIEGEGGGEPVAKRIKAAEESTARSCAELGGQFTSRLVQVKQVPARGPSGLSSPNRTPGPFR